MKFPKNRANLYLVERNDPPAIVGAFAFYDEAEDFAGACQQDWDDKLGPDSPINTKFQVIMTTFYG